MQRNLLFKFLSGIVQTFSDKLLNKGSLKIMIIETLFIAIFFFIYNFATIIDPINFRINYSFLVLFMN